ncbi:hypothetical protein [Breoghania sp. JC706]|uniref:hypothetical protein n=1 Tax=Breoghania sp. JC706 TaxID=3117732 RepID=UPI00300B8F0B
MGSSSASLAAAAARRAWRKARAGIGAAGRRGTGDRAIAVYAVLIVLTGGLVAALLLFHDEFTGLVGAGEVPVHSAAQGRGEDGAGFRAGRPDSALAPARPPYSRFAPTLDLSPPVEAADAETLRAGRRTVRLAFVAPMPGGAFCVDRFLNRGRCSTMGQVALQRLVGPVGAECRPVFYPAGAVRYQCFAGNVDIARHQLAAGLLKPDALMALPRPALPSKVIPLRLRSTL